MIRRNTWILSFLAITASVLACVPTFSPAPIPTFDPNSINQSIALTANAAATQTARMLPPSLTPTVTSQPSKTPTETPTPTFLFLLPTITIIPTLVTPGSSSEPYECQILSQDPLNESKFAPRAEFEMKWQVANIGKNAWFSSDTDYRFASGERMHKESIYDLNESVVPGGKINLIVSMKAPAESGTYKTQWNINIGKNSFCPLKLTIIVN